MKDVSNKVTAAMAVIGVVWGGFIYWNDIRYMVTNVSVRNISYYKGKICEDPNDTTMWEGLQDELARYKRYKGREHRYEGVKFPEICE